MDGPIPLQTTLWVFLACACFHGLTQGYQCPGGCRCKKLEEDLNGWNPVCWWAGLPEVTNFDLLFSANETISLDIFCHQNAKTPNRLANGTFSKFTRLLYLGIFGCQLMVLEPDTFSGVSGMLYLVINLATGEDPNVKLTISKGAFNHEGLENLKLVSLYLNNISKIPSDAFCGLGQLQLLNLSHNFISSDSNLGLSTTCDEKQDIANCTICEMTHLTALDISFNRLQRLEHPLSHSCKALVKIYFSHNHISSVNSDVFKNLTYLQVLGLSNNRLGILRGDQFHGLVNLAVLSLAFNYISHIPRGLFRDTSKLVYLDFQNNHLENQVLDIEVLGDLVNLNMLSLAENRISSLNGCMVFKNMTNLDKLYLHVNNIDYIPDSCFRSQTRLSELYLSNNNLTRLTNMTFHGLNHLIILHLADNPLLTISNGLFSPFRRSLRYLNMSQCQLKVIPAELKHLSELQEVALSFNQISLLDPEAFSGLDKMQFLHMEWNSIEEIPRNAFQKMPSLGFINLYNNKIKILKLGSFDNMDSLYYVNLNNNEIVDIIAIFHNLPRLQYLHLRNNRIEVLGNRLFFLPKTLLLLDVSHNNISAIEEKPFFGMPFIRTVNMWGNPLQKFQKEDLEVSPPLTRPNLLLSEDIMCDCTMAWMLSINAATNRGNYMAIPDIENLECANLEEVQLTSLKFEEFFCELSRFCTSDDYILCPCCRDVLFGRNPQVCPPQCWQECPEGCRCYKNHIWSYPTIIKVICDNQNMSQIPHNLPKSVWDFSFSGNHIRSLQPGLFENCSKAYELSLDGNKISYIAPNAFEGLDRLTDLDLHGNELTSLHQWMFNHIESTLTHLYLQDNKIQSIDNDTFALFDLLHTLLLHNNNLLSMSQPIFIGKSVNSLTLSENPWLCDCGNGPPTQMFLFEVAQVTSDIGDVICDPDREWGEWIYANVTTNDTTPQREDILTSDAPFSSTSFPEISQTVDMDLVSQETSGTHYSILQADFGFCDPRNVSTIINNQLVNEKAHIIALSVVSTLFLFSVTVALTIYSLRELIKLWLFKHFGLRFYHPQEEENKEYDAFISYSSKDELLVIRELVPGLEAMDPPYKLCLHYKDWPVGASIADTIIQSVNNSRRTILLVSDDFVKSEWCQYEFQAAHHQVLKDKKTRLIVILLNDISPKALDPQLRLYIKTNTYLKWTDPRFWDRLRYVMPDKTVKEAEHEEYPMDIVNGMGPANGEPPQVAFGQGPRMAPGYMAHLPK